MLPCLLQSLPHLLLSSESIKVEITTVFGNLTFRALALRQREICPDEAKKSPFKPFRVVVRPLSTCFDKNKIFMFLSHRRSSSVSVQPRILPFFTELTTGLAGL